MEKYLYVGILLTMFVFTGCNEKLETEEQVKKDELKISPVNQSTEDKTVSDMNEEKTKTPLKLIEEQKEEYHKQYVKIVEKVNQQKLGMQLGVSPIDEFKAEDWVEPEVFANRIQEQVDVFLEEERKALAVTTTKKNQDATEVSGGWALEKYIYVSGILTRIEIIVDFETQYSESRNGQVFAGINKISTQVAKGSEGTWEQTSYKATLLDDQTYSIRIEGIHHYNNLSIDKLFTIEISCDKFGKIH
ncbi:hypothetical protein [Lysinibacillus sp. Ag94]|uniref:hypothetical protein n=1 Tax=Lysinibacillus sp. Ag94 TaxID=2936682 RepID=UPI002010A1F6|nr:hypothetical protein [Lysinibacillus sp. Ag94]UPW84452.1 hypothetical protein MY533_06175 [Lysinibacillus sp. Ag94]